MQTNQLEIWGAYSINFNNKKLPVMHVTMTNDFFCRHFFFVHFTDKQIVFAKELIDGAVFWTGHALTPYNEQLCNEIERQAGLELPPLYNTDPFDYDGTLPVSIKAFYIDSIKVEKAKTPFDDVEAVYYRLHIEEGWIPKVAYIRMPLNRDWEWRPASKLSKEDFEFIVEMITEFEDGTYEAYNQMNASLVLLLQNLQRGDKPAQE